MLEPAPENGPALDTLCLEILKYSGAQVSGPGTDREVAISGLPPAIARVAGGSHGDRTKLKVQGFGLGEPLTEAILAWSENLGRLTSVVDVAGLSRVQFERTVAEIKGNLDPDKGRLTIPGHGSLKTRTILFPNSRPELVSAVLRYTQTCMFAFRVVYWSDGKTDEVRCVSVDTSTEKRVRCPSLEGSDGWTFLPAGLLIGSGTAELGYGVKKAYAAATKYLLADIRRTRQTLERESSERLRAEMDRLIEYYNAMEEESYEPLGKALHRLAAVTVREQLARSECNRRAFEQKRRRIEEEVEAIKSKYLEEVEVLSRERERRISEYSAAYRLRVSVELLGMAVCWTPELHLLVRLKALGRDRPAPARSRSEGRSRSADGPAGPEVGFSLRLRDYRLSGPYCENCGEPVWVIYRTPEGSAVGLCCKDEAGREDEGSGEDEPGGEVKGLKGDPANWF